MSPIRFAAIALPMLLLAGCGGSAPAPTAPSSETSTAAEAPAAAPAAPATTDSTSVVIGTWAVDPAQCTAPVVISATKYSEGSKTCDVSGFTDNGNGTMTADMSCGGSAEQVNMRPIFGPLGAGIDLSGSAAPTTVYRCPAPKS